MEWKNHGIPYGKKNYHKENKIAFANQNISKWKKKCPYSNQNISIWNSMIFPFHEISIFYNFRNFLIDKMI